MKINVRPWVNMLKYDFWVKSYNLQWWDLRPYHSFTTKRGKVIYALLFYFGGGPYIPGVTLPYSDSARNAVVVSTPKPRPHHHYYSPLSRPGVNFSAEQTDTIKALIEQDKIAEAQRLILDKLEEEFDAE